MKLPISLLCATMIASMCVGCSSSSTEPTAGTNIQTLFPMKVGNTWTYQNINFGATMNDTSAMTVLVYANGTFGTTAGFYVSATDTAQGEPDSNFFYFAAGGTKLYSVRDLMALTPRSDLSFQYPMPAGDSLVMRDTIYSDSSHSRSVTYLISKAESITTPAGSFSCVHFLTNKYYADPGAQLTLEGTDHIYLAPNVGVVQEKLAYLNSSTGVIALEFQTTLQSYSLK
jgi:hypothetical protein